MSKYEPLSRYLEKRGATVTLSFTEIEKILGFALPPSARQYAAWWSNNAGSHVQANAWLEAGFKTEDVDLAGQHVGFAPAEKTEEVHGGTQKTFAEQMRAGGSKPPQHPAWGAWRGLVTILSGVDLTKPADPDWGKTYDADHSAKSHEQ